MPQKINLSAPPYNDDYKSDKGFYRVLFRPGYSIQTRELTSLQSILQNQIESIGRSNFKQGQQVIPGEVSFNNKLDYVKLSLVSEVATNVNGNIVFKKYDIANLVGSTLQGLSSGVTATVVSYSYGTDIESDIIFVIYTNSGNGSVESTFRQGETLEAIDIADTPTLVVGTNGSVLPSTIDIKDYDTGEIQTIESPAMGYASAVKVEQGVYFINGFFVNNSEQLIIVDKYYSKPSAKVGFLIKESIVTPEEDSSLYDNARGFSNYSAPGSHRLKIDLQLTVKEYDSSVDQDYVQLVVIKNGEIQQLIKSTDYNLIEETLAKRTFDESGDYVVDDFSLDLREYYQNNNNKGIYPLNKQNNLVNNLTPSEASSLMVAGVGPGKAYIKGYEIVNKQPKYINVNKSRDVLTKEDVRIKSSSLSYFNTTNVYGSIPLNADGQELSAYPTIELNSTFTDGTIGYNNTETSSGSGAAAVASVSNGSVTSIQITNNGSGYTAAPSVSFSAPPQGGTTATGIANISSGKVTGITITNAGSGYSVAPSVSFTDSVKQTVQRRSKKFSLNDGIITIYLANPGNYAPNRAMPTPQTFGSSLSELWYVSNKGTSFATTTAKKVELLSYSIVKRPFDVSVNSPEIEYLELTVSGDKEDLLTLFKEYDETDTVAKRRKLFVTEDDAKRYYFQTNSGISPYSEIFDYNEVSTPVIGLCKPKDFSLLKKGNGFNVDTNFVLSKGRLSDGSTTYNSIFRLSYFNPVFFTRLTLDTPLSSGIFTSGKYVLGSTSGAYGVIEGYASSKYSIGNILFVKTLSGQFLPGETITDESGNSRRIAREGTISHFVVTNRGAGYPVSTIIKINGISYESSAIEISYSIGSIYKIIIKDRNLVSQVYSSTPSISFDTGITNPSSSAIVTPVLYRNTVYNYSQKDVKSLQSSFGSGNKYTFTADIETFDSTYVSSKIVTDFTFSGDKGSKYIECNGFSGNPAADLSKGDIIQFTDVSNNPVRSVVQRVDKTEGLIKAKVYLDNVLRENVSNTNVVKVIPNIENSSTSTLIIPTGSKYLKSVVDSPENSNIKYYFRRDFITTASTSGGNITFAAQLPYGTQRFASFTEENFILTVLDKKSATTYNNVSGGESVESGDIIYLKKDQVTISNSTSTDNALLTAGSVSIDLPASFFGTNTDFPILKLTATLEVTKSRPRLKTAFTNKKVLVISPGDRVVPIRGIDYDSNSSDVLSYSDVYKVRYIYEGTTQTPPVVSDSGELVTGTDVTERFSFDDGQRDTFYDVSRLILKPGFDPPSGQLIISFDYFEHSQGDFCTVDSYLHESGVSLDQIPEFNSTVLGKISLRDVIDFRPKVDSSSIISGYQDTSLLSAQDYNSFTGSGGIVSSTPATENSLDYTISFNTKQYLDRIDAVFVSKKGDFFIKEGNSSLNPTKPADIDDCLALYYLFIPAYTSNANDVRIIPIDNKRYTMRDIGKLERRIERLEKYTMLSILEQQALNMQIKDDIGLDRFKTGFVVDGFENHGIGNVSSIDHKCSIDTQQSVLRPRSFEDSFDLLEVNTKKEQRITDGYTRTNNIVTLPYTSVPSIKNEYATKTLNINPFVVIQYAGDARLYPNTDTWFDSNESPLILDNDSKLFSVFYAKNDPRDGFASIFNNYIINWIGTNRVFYNTSSLSNIDSITASATTKLASTSSSSNISPQNNQLAQGVSSKAIGSSSIVSSIQTFCRTRPVYFNITRMKPKTKLFVFMDGKSIDRWAIQDYVYTGIAGNSLSSFGSGIFTDANGNASGMILIPSGYAPQEGSTWNNDLNSVQYDTENSTPLSFITGIKTIKFTSDENGIIDSTVDTFAEINYYATGSLPLQPNSIISTSPAIFKSAEGIQFIDNTRSQVSPNPLSQSFRIEKYPGGIFFTGIDLFFNKKSLNIPVKVYITNIESGKPGKYIVPGSECILNPDTYLKIYTNGTVTIKKGEYITGVESRCSGPIKEIYDRNNILISPSITGDYILSNLQVYTLVLDNHNGKEFKQGESLNIPSVSSFNAAQNTNLQVSIAKDSGRITGLKINNLGSGYEDALLTVESPQLIGGINAVATCSVSNGSIYDANISVQGSGYTEVPSIIINGTGISASNASIEAILTIDTPAVRMGVAVDPTDSTTIQSTTPTRFNFRHPVYLQNNTDYAFVVESDSTDYVLWASKLGEIEVASQSAVTSQPLLGSLFKSQNVDTWSEDLFEDIKFTLYRAEFDISRNGILHLTNEQLNYEALDSNPFETNSLSDTTATSLLFKNNNKIVKVKHRYNGFEDSGNSYVAFKNASDIGGVTSEYLNSNIFKIYNSGLNSYDIMSINNASSTVVGGGNKVLAKYNRKYEKLYAQISLLNFNETSINAEVKTTNIVPVDSRKLYYDSYSSTPYEKTFLNEDHYFNNQKVLATRINELKNIDSIYDQSLTYKIILSSKLSYLSPVIDLSSCSVKLVTNEVEKSAGQENRYGRRDQVITFYPVYKFIVNGLNTNSIQVGDASNPKLVYGLSSKARAEIVKNDTVNNEVYVKMLTDTLFVANESLEFTSQPSLTGISVANTGLTEIPFNFPYNSTVTCVDKTDITKIYSNVISGKVVSWDPQNKILVLSNNKNPINANYTAVASAGSDYARIPKSSVSVQVPDIFRVSDIVTYENQDVNTRNFLEIKSVEFTTGVLYVSENNNNSSSLAKYLTKEISLDSSSTSLDVRLTANIYEEDDIKVLYKIKPISSQFNFDDIGWEYFNVDGRPDTRVIPSSDNFIAGYIESQESYKEYKFSAFNLTEFSSFAIKIVMRSSNPVYVSKIQDVKIVASY